MAKFISVLNSNLKKQKWEAIQWGDTYSSVKSNKYYRAGVSKSIPKSNNDAELDEKQVTEVYTLKNGQATIVKLSQESRDLISVANNTISQNKLNKLTK